MTNIELAELFVLRLYDLAEAGGYSRFHSLDEIAKEFGVTDRVKGFNIGKSLEKRGLITPVFTHAGSSACINGDDALFVEQGGSTGVIPTFRCNPERFLVSVSLQGRLTIAYNLLACKLHCFRQRAICSAVFKLFEFH